MSEDQIKVKVTSHENFLVIETVNPQKDKNFEPVGGSKIGSVLMDTGEFLGMSDEAFELMKTVKSGGDDIGDIDTFETDTRGQCFAWMGPLKRLVNVNEAECSRTGIIDLKYIPIENKIPLEAFEAITKMKGDE